MIFSPAAKVIYPAEAGEFTQALMELGATVCGPNRAPDCTGCPCRAFCLGYQRGTAVSLPVKLPKKERREEDRTVFILRCQDCYAIAKRPEKGLLAGLWQLPDVPGKMDVSAALEYLESQGVGVENILRQADKIHIFTHVQWNMRGFFLDCTRMGGPWQWISETQVEQQLALPTAYRQFWEERNM